MEELPLNDEREKGKLREERSLYYMGAVLGLLILVMGYLTLFVDDPWKIFRKTPETPLSAPPVELLQKAQTMSDEEVRQSLVKFINAFYFDQQRGYFDPPSYFAPITETFYNYHNLTYPRVKELYWSRRADQDDLKFNWLVSSLDFKRDSSGITVNYWVKETFYRISRRIQESIDVHNELMIDGNGKIFSFKELEVSGGESPGTQASAVDSIDAVKVNPTPDPVSAAPPVEPEVNDQKVFELGTADAPAEFPGGQKELVKFLTKNLRYPAAARQNEVEGKVFAGFIIEKNGTISDLKVLRGVGSGCDEEALRVIRTLPAWKPAVQGGQSVRSAYVLSVAFKLSN